MSKDGEHRRILLVEVQRLREKLGKAISDEGWAHERAMTAPDNSPLYDEFMLDSIRKARITDDLAEALEVAQLKARDYSPPLGPPTQIGDDDE